jgi:pimeloyl-ACP methyl ester carboxylesterase
MPTVDVPHLGGITAGYRLSNGALDPAKPTVVLVNAMCMTTALYESQFASARLTDNVNLLAVEPLGHGETVLRGGEQFTAWDSATMILQVMAALGVERAFALGTSMGGWIVTRMALLAPDRVCSPLLTM